MVNWMDPAVIETDAKIFNRLMMVFLGIYVWEFICTLDYDWSVVSRARKFKYPMIVYFLCRYFLLFALIAINISLNITKRVNCQSLYTFNQVAGNIAIGAASTLLMLRTVAIWSRNIYVLIPLGCLALGQWAILFYGVLTVKAMWVPAANACVVTGTGNTALNLIYIYTMTYDLVVLLLSVAGLVKTAGRSDLWQLLFRDGLFYFFVAFTANLIPAIFLILNLNPAMNIMFTVPAAVASSIVATRGFVRLANWGSQQERQGGSGPGGATGITHRRSQGGNRPPFDVALESKEMKGTKSKIGLANGVHISTEAYTISDNAEYLKDLERLDEASSIDGHSDHGGARFTHAGIRSPEAPRITFSGAPQGLSR